MAALYFANWAMILADGIIEWVVLPWSIISSVLFGIILVYELVEAEINLEEAFSATVTE